MKMQSSRNQYYAIFCANITGLIYGINIAWASPNIPLLESVLTPLASGIPSLPEESSWIVSYISIGGIISSLLFVWISNFIGRKGGVLLIAVPQIANWLLLEYGQNIDYLYISRFLAGFAGGGVFILIPLYASEIAETRIRGQLGAVLSIICNLGIFLGFIINSYLDYYLVPWICIGLDVIFIVGFIIVPDTPQFLISKNKLMEAENSLKFYRGVSKESLGSDEFILELQNMKKEYEMNSLKSSGQNKLTISDFTERGSLRAIIISVKLMALAVLSGSFPIINYTASIFAEAGSSLSPAMSSVIVTCVQLIGCCFCSIFVDRFGRKILLVVSAIMSGLSLITIGVFMYLKFLNCDVSSFRWIPIASLSTFVLFAAGGILSLPYIVMPEILPQKIKGPMATFCLFELWFLSFLIIKLYPVMLALFGTYGTMWCYGIFCFLGAVFVIILVPETKGKSMDEIRQMLSIKNNSRT